MPAINFKNVGVLKYGETGSSSTVSASLRPIGVKTPLEFDKANNNLFKMHTNVRNQVADNLRNLILTNWGERLGLYFFGANLRPLLTEYTNKTQFDQEAAVRINTAVTKWMPFLELIEFDSAVDYENNEFLGIVRLYITYGIPALNVASDQLEVVLAVV